MSPSFDALPWEIIEKICSHLSDTHAPSIYTLSLVNKHCCAISNVHRFRSIQLIAPNEKRLTQTIQHWTRVLERNSSFGRVRRLKVEIGHSKHGNFDIEGTLGGRLCDDSDSDDEFRNRGRRYRHIFSDRVVLPQPCEPDAWKPLAELMRNLPGLKDFVYACTTPLSPVILSVLHETLLDCNLHIRSYQLWSLHQHPDNPQKPAPDEMALATSPNLRSIVLPYYVWDSDELRNYNYEAALQMIAWMAPSLERVDFVYCPDITAWPYYVLRSFNTPPWKGSFSDQLQPRLQLGQLRELSLSPVRLQDLQQLAEHTAFSEIRALRLWGTIHDSSLEWLTESCSFPSLKKLALHAFDDRDDGRSWMNVTPEVKRSGAAFISSLPPLQSLQLSTDLGQETFEAVIYHHGSALRKLHFVSYRSSYDFVFTEDRVEDISMHCPQVEDLAVPVPRTKGDAQEVGIYRSLGTFRRLKRLTLFFDRSITLTPYWAGSIIAPKARDLLMNAAIDEELARSIFRTITEAHPEVRCPLEWLRLEPGGDGLTRFNHRWLHNLLCNILRYLSGRFLCTRSPRDDARDEVIVQEIGARERQIIGELAPDSLGYFEEIFRDLWPEGTGDWRKDWRSIPLASEGSSGKEGSGWLSPQWYLACVVA